MRTNIVGSGVSLDRAVAQARGRRSALPGRSVSSPALPSATPDYRTKTIARMQVGACPSFHVANGPPERQPYPSPATSPLRAVTLAEPLRRSAVLCRAAGHQTLKQAVPFLNQDVGSVVLDECPAV